MSPSTSNTAQSSPALARPRRPSRMSSHSGSFSASNTLLMKSYTHQDPGMSGILPPNFSDIPFLGTPFTLGERPYEYPFPSPATESYPTLPILSGSSALKHAYTSRRANDCYDSPPTLSGSGLVNAASALANHVHPPSSYAHPVASLLKRRASSAGSLSSASSNGATSHPSATLVLGQEPPVPPGLLARDGGQLSPRLRGETAAASWRRSHKPGENK